MKFANAQATVYNDTVVRQFAIMTVVWGVVGMLVGVIIAAQSPWPELNLGISWLSYGRLLPVHANDVMCASGGCGLFASAYYVVQRTCHVRLFNDKLASFTFWGWQLVIVSAAITLPMGLTTSKEYAELEWPIDILITLVWVAYTVVFFGTVIKRKTKHIYVSNWFFGAYILTIAMLHIFNNLEMPASLFKSYSAYSGAQDAMIQWWYGHNAVAFFLTTPYLGLMYYFVPKAANRPVYSYRLSIIHFWALIFLYIWAGPHHLLYSTLPDWAQSLGVVFSVMLIAPSWGGMLNGLLTLRGAWDRVRDDILLKFMVVALTCYGMSTFEGPLLSLKNINVISHFTDWTIAHVHIGGLGWNGMLTFGMLYWLFPRLYNTKLYSTKMANQHFWIATLGIILYAIPMYIAGFMQGLMWQEFKPDGTLANNFVDTVIEMKPFFYLRSIGGLLYLSGAILMFYNLVKTAKSGKLVANEETEAVVTKELHVNTKGEYWHKVIERKPIQFMILSLVIVAIGGIVEIIPTMIVKSNVPTIKSVKPYTPLELYGRDIYIREGCYNCHSQLIRPLRFETVRYGAYSKSGEFVYDHPFQWGSKRTGPDLAREGGVRGNLWHFNHMIRPKVITPGSIMPAYPWMREDDMDIENIGAKIRAMQTLGVPYPEDYDKKAKKDLHAQAHLIALDIVNTSNQIALKGRNKNDLIKEIEQKDIVAIIAYLQRLGTDVKVKPTK